MHTLSLYNTNVVNRFRPVQTDTGQTPSTRAHPDTLSSGHRQLIATEECIFINHVTKLNELLQKMCDAHLHEELMQVPWIQC